MIEYIPPIQERILLALARYKFLTVSQLYDANVGVLNRIRDALAILRAKKLTAKQQFGGMGYAYKGTVQDIHYLTSKGAKILLEHSDLQTHEIKYPKSTNTFFRHDYYHRIATINAEIALEKWMQSHKAEKLFCCNYTDKAGSQRSNNEHEKGTLRSETRLTFSDSKFIEPDIIFGYRTPQKNYLYCLEIYNGKDTKRVIEQLVKLAQATSEGLVGSTFGYEVDNRVLCSFEHESNMKAVIERIHNENVFRQKGIEKFFFFNLHESIKQDFGKNWFSINSEMINLADF
ncbi:MAG: replication-relaxation family protein [Arcicella sp.]|jgi:hypothetical protein|nr:replication-relaxation family protein [Arcicella sp.]